MAGVLPSANHEVCRVLGWVLPGQPPADAVLYAGPIPAPVEQVCAAMCFVQDRDGSFVVVYSPRRGEWGSPGGRREPGESVLETACREVHEETGLVLAAEQLSPCGYEELTIPGEETPSEEAAYIQAFRARLDQVRPRLTPLLDDVSAARWMSWQDFADHCDELAWWPLAAELYGGDE